MGCLLMGVAALLSLAMPAAIARSSLVGAYVLIGLLTVLALAGVSWRARQRRVPGAAASRSSVAVVRIGVLAAAYAAIVTAVHFAG